MSDEKKSARTVEDIDMAVGDFMARLAQDVLVQRDAFMPASIPSMPELQSADDASEAEKEANKKLSQDISLLYTRRNILHGMYQLMEDKAQTSFLEAIHKRSALANTDFNEFRDQAKTMLLDLFVRYENPWPCIILAFNGGGVRGYGTLVLLKHFLNHLISTSTKSKIMTSFTEYRFFKHCDLICGTSTGAIIATYIRLHTDKITARLQRQETVPESELNGIVDGAIAMYKHIASTMFSAWNRRWFTYGFRSKYGPLLTTMVETDDKLGWLRDAKDFPEKLLVCSLDRRRLELLTFHSGNQYVTKAPGKRTISLRDAVIGSCSAPTYFDSKEVKVTDPDNPNGLMTLDLVDGGVWANNPSLVGLSNMYKDRQAPDAKHNNINRQTGTRYVLFNFGTGSKKPQFEDFGQGPGQWVWDARIITTLMECNELTVSRVCQKLYDADSFWSRLAYNSFDFKLDKSFKLDDAAFVEAVDQEVENDKKRADDKKSDFSNPHSVRITPIMFYSLLQKDEADRRAAEAAEAAGQ